MFSMPSIVIVDNEQDELTHLQKAFFESGLPCLPVLYIGDDPSNDSGVDHINVPAGLQPRILIIDLNLQRLSSSSLNAKNLVAPIAKVIEKFSKSGPYLLGIWSTHEEEHGEVISLLESRYKNKIALPISWTFISKSEFLSNGQDEAQKSALKSRVQGLINESPIFAALVNWEGRITEAARKTTETLHQLAIPKSIDQGYIEQLQKNLSGILAAIGNETLGYHNARDNPGAAMDMGLTPVLSDHLNSITDPEDGLIWGNALPELGQPHELEQETKAKLNSFYSIEEVVESYPLSCRGVFIEINENYVSTAELVSKLETRLGAKIPTIMNDEFIRPNGSKSHKRIVRDSVTLGFLEISAECDHAQRKVKLHRYVLGALIPIEHSEYTYFETNGQKKNTAHEGIYRLPIISIKGKEYLLKLSFKYQIGAAPNDNKWFGKPLLRIRDQVLADISFRCAQYGSRPGIIRFD